MRPTPSSRWPSRSGEAYQFDWSEESLVVGSIYYRVQGGAHESMCLAILLAGVRRDDDESVASRMCLKAGIRDEVLVCAGQPKGPVERRE